MSALSDLIDLFSKLPGLGPRSARRIVLYLLKNKERVIPNISEMLENLKTSAIFCKFVVILIQVHLAVFVLIKIEKVKKYVLLRILVIFGQLKKVEHTMVAIMF